MHDDHWQRSDPGEGGEAVESRWCGDHKTRIQRRFRHHVRTPSNPLGRIHREPCAFSRSMKHGKCWSPWRGMRRGEEGATPAPEWPATDAHHPDYTRPWAVVWVCFAHHRKIDHGSLRIGKRDVWDYSSLIEGIGKRGLRVGADGSREGVPF